MNARKRGKGGDPYKKSVAQAYRFAAKATMLMDGKPVKRGDMIADWAKPTH